MNIHLTALIRCKKGHTAQFSSLLKELVKASNEEEACLKYELYQAASDHCQFIFQETWRDQEGLDLHNQQPHLLGFLKSAAALMDGNVIVYPTKRLY
jgi:quinol monooxygenase YgiN